MSWTLTRRARIGWAAAVLLAAVSATLLVDRPAGAATASRVFTYKVVQARLDVVETGKYVSDSRVRWDGTGHQHDRLAGQDDELPPLPVPIPTGGRHGVFALTDVIWDGDETLIGADGKKAPCSGVWERKKQGGITVVIKQIREGKLLTIWDIPHGLATNRCGFSYDLIEESSVQSKKIIDGDIGDHRLVFRIDRKLEKTKEERHGTKTQVLKWEGLMVLKRF